MKKSNFHSKVKCGAHKNLFTVDLHIEGLRVWSLTLVGKTDSSALFGDSDSADNFRQPKQVTFHPHYCVLSPGACLGTEHDTLKLTQFRSHWEVICLPNETVLEFNWLLAQRSRNFQCAQLQTSLQMRTWPHSFIRGWLILSAGQAPAPVLVCG